MSLVLQKSFQVRRKRVEGKREGVKGKRERWCMEGRETVVAGFMYVCIIGCCKAVLREES